MSGNGLDKELNANYAGVLNPDKVRTPLDIDNALKIADFDPFAGNMLVDPIPAPEMAGSLFMPEKARENPGLAWVLKLPSSGDAAGFSVGDLVYYVGECGTAITIEGRKLKLLVFCAGHLGEPVEVLGRWPVDKLRTART